MTQVNTGKSQEEVDRYQHRTSNFYSQTIEENNARLNAKWAAADTLNELRQATLEEIKFIQSRLLAR